MSRSSNSKYSCERCRRPCADGILSDGRIFCVECYHIVPLRRRKRQRSLFEFEPISDDASPYVQNLACAYCVTPTVYRTRDMYWCGKCHCELGCATVVLLKHPDEPVEGWVYVLTNYAMPGLVKVGKTEIDPHERAMRLYCHTGVPQAFDVRYKRKVLCCVEAERRAHERLKPYRVNPRREFFVVSEGRAIEAVKDACIDVDFIHRDVR
jgi:hypothetical protein